MTRRGGGLERWINVPENDSPQAGRVVPVFDGHNDVLLRLHKRGGDDAARAFLTGEGKGQLDLPMARRGGLFGGLFAIFVPSPSAPAKPTVAPTQSDSFPETPPGLDRETAEKVSLEMASLLARIERESDGRVRICRSAGDIHACLRDDAMAAVLHMEGVEAIDEDLAFLDVLYEMGLRSLGPVWSRPNIFGYGVPFRFPSSPDIGPGLSEAGKALIRRCNELKILVDLSHLNEKGFWDVAAISDAPLVASHSNAHAICNHARNLTDDQLAAIRKSRGLVGVNFAVAFLRPDGAANADTPLDVIVDHIDYLIAHLGEEGVALGSDFDGARIPAALGTAAGLQELVGVMRARGYAEERIEKVCYRNWVELLSRTWAP